MKIRYRYVFNRKGKLNSMGLGQIHIEATQNGRKAYFATNVFVEEKQFDGIIVNHPHAAELNGMLMEMVMQLESYEVALWRQGRCATLEDLRNSWHNKVDQNDFVEYATTMIQKSSRKEHTKLNLMQTVKKVERFKRLNIEEVDYRFLRCYEEWLREQGFHPNTIYKEMCNVKTVISEALREGLIQIDPFIRYRLPRTVGREHITLTEEELKLIASARRYPYTRDAFLFCCCTGLRFSDYTNLDESKFRILNGKRWLVFTTVKTGVEVRIPIHLFGDLPHPTITSNSVVNRQLQEICKEVGIAKKVSFHTARHTFATLLINKGVPITSVQRMLGHTSVRMTERYAELSDKKMESDLAQITDLKSMVHTP